MDESSGGGNGTELSVTRNSTTEQKDRDGFRKHLQYIFSKHHTYIITRLRLYTCSQRDQQSYNLTAIQLRLLSQEVTIEGSSIFKTIGFLKSFPADFSSKT
jgi:hypothetical protein